MHVEVDNSDALDPVPVEGVIGGDDDIVEDAKAGRPAGRRVVTRGAGRAEGSALPGPSSTRSTAAMAPPTARRLASSV